MGQLGFFDADKRLQALSARGDPLEAIDHLVPWESFRAEIEAVVLTPDELRKSSAGRKPFDAILNQDGIERLPASAAFPELVRCEHHRLDLSAKALPRHEMIDGFERIAPR